MPSVRGTIQFLADHPLYTVEKPYRVLLPEQVKPDGLKTHNLEYGRKSDVLIHDIREAEIPFTLGENGFQVVESTTRFTRITSQEDLEEYKGETEAFLQKFFGAEAVHCWDALVGVLIAIQTPLITIHSSAKRNHRNGSLSI
jgi:hypothetical protein